MIKDGDREEDDEDRYLRTRRSRRLRLRNVLKKEEIKLSLSSWPAPPPPSPLLMSSIGPQVVRRGVVVGGHSFLPQPPEGRRMLKITGMALS